MGLPERCLLWPTAGPPMLPTSYNNNYQILQVPGYVVILIEMIHDVRIIPLDGRPHLPQHIRQWLGDSRGHWEGNTLVVDTTNFTDKTHFRGADRNLHLIERFTRSDPNTILYEFTVDDPTAFTQPWKAQAPLTKTAGPIYEYACHEGNYSMFNMLKGARASGSRRIEVNEAFSGQLSAFSRIGEADSLTADRRPLLLLASFYPAGIVLHGILDWQVHGVVHGVIHLPEADHKHDFHYFLRREMLR